MKLPLIDPRPDLYDEAERWSVDELRARQLERLRGRCGARTTTSRTTGRRSTTGASTPTTSARWRTCGISRSPPRPTCGTTTRSACSRCRASRSSRVHASSGTTGRPTVVGYTGEDLRTWASLMARSIRAAGGRPGDVVHVAYGYGLFTGGLGAHYGAEALGCTVVPVSGGHDRAAGPADHRLRAAGDHGDAVVLPVGAGRDGAGGLDPRDRRWRSASSAPSRGPRRCAPRSRSGPACTRSTSTGCPR